MGASNEVVWIVMNMLLSLRCGWVVRMGVVMVWGVGKIRELCVIGSWKLLCVVTACLLLVRGWLDS